MDWRKVIMATIVAGGIWLAYYIQLRDREGEPLPEKVQRVLGPYFPELDLSKVKVVIKDEKYLPTFAGAFTPVWNCIVIRPSQWNPDTVKGLATIANELTHVKQWQEMGFIFLPTFAYQRLAYGVEKGSLEEESTKMMLRVFNDLYRTGVPV